MIKPLNPDHVPIVSSPLPKKNKNKNGGRGLLSQAKLINQVFRSSRMVLFIGCFNQGRQILYLENKSTHVAKVCFW